MKVVKGNFVSRKLKFGVPHWNLYIVTMVSEDGNWFTGTVVESSHDVNVGDVDFVYCGDIGIEVVADVRVSWW